MVPAILQLTVKHSHRARSSRHLPGRQLTQGGLINNKQRKTSRRPIPRGSWRPLSLLGVPPLHWTASPMGVGSSPSGSTGIAHHAPGIVGTAESSTPPDEVLRMTALSPSFAPLPPFDSILGGITELENAQKTLLCPDVTPGTQVVSRPAGRVPHLFNRQFTQILSPGHRPTRQCRYRFTEFHSGNKDFVQPRNSVTMVSRAVFNCKFSLSSIP
jgi:hypothetical protein